MGLLRKTTSISTLGLVSYRNNTEKIVKAVRSEAKSVQSIAKANKKLTKAQIKALKRK